MFHRIRMTSLDQGNYDYPRFTDEDPKLPQLAKWWNQHSHLHETIRIRHPFRGRMGWEESQPHVLSYKMLLLLLLSRFSCVQLCETPEMAAHQAPPSLGFSRQEHWNRLPFPSPVHESEKWKWSRSVVSDSSRPHGLQPTRLLRPWEFPGKSNGAGCHCLLRSYKMSSW